MSAYYNALTGEFSGDWPKPGNPLSLESANALMDVYEEVRLFEDKYNVVYSTREYIPMYEKACSDQRQKLLALIWNLLDEPVRPFKRTAA